MSEIKVGEYVRTKKGIIEKFKRYTKSIFFDANDIETENGIIFIEDDIVVKHSSNIIDLIEVGDYVNGKLIHKVDIRENSAYIYYGNCKTFTDKDVKSIVTKEQFAEMEYRL